MQRLDLAVESMGVRLLNLPWRSFEYEEGDADHFTERGIRSFSETLASQTPLQGRVLILADSTVDHVNWAKSGWSKRTTKAHDLLAQAFRVLRPGLHLRVESDAGAGYVAKGVRGNTFLTLLERGADHRPDVVILLGGWNDAGKRTVVESAAVLWSRGREVLEIEP